ncbi:hypothetical protein KKB83_01015 [Patescibacteria group bacterium]|nr:hypothetical protein [Patescibacteria group bacterium]
MCTCSGGSLDPRQEELYSSVARLQPEADPPLAEKPSRYNKGLGKFVLREL